MFFKKNRFLVLFAKGLAMGAADVVPGVSGGTIAFISGIYKELIESISNINYSLWLTLKKEGFKSFWKAANLNFLLAVFSGVLVSALSVMNVMHTLLQNYPIQVWSFFFGLVLASILFVAKKIKKCNSSAIAILLLSSAFAFVLTQLSVAESTDSLWYLFVCGGVAICAMILPGISGSFILLLMGGYSTISEAVHNRQLTKLLVFFLGCIVGVLSFSKLLKWLFAKYENATLVFLTGFIVGSLNKIWPWKNTLESKIINGKSYILKETSVLPSNYLGEANIYEALFFMILGFILILGLEKLALKQSGQV